jgi:hypothetical protein
MRKEEKATVRKNVKKETRGCLIDREELWNDPMCFPSFKA